MTHPLPTTAPEAPPLPLCGEGSGVGGRPLAVLAALILLPLSATAQVIPTGTPAVDILLSQAIADQRVFLTCTALDPANHQIALDFWQSDAAKAVTLLAAAKVPAEAIAAFTSAAAPDSLMPAEGTPFAEVMHFCASQDHWFDHWSRRDFTELAATLPKVLP